MIFKRDEFKAGIKDLQRRLHYLDDNDVNKITSSAVSAAFTPLAKEMRREAPRRKQNKSKVHRIHKAIGRKKKSKKRRLVSGKVGGNVGPAGKGTKRAHHLHLNTLGTKRRRTKSGANRGRMPRNDFIRRATKRVMPVAVNRMIWTGVSKGKALIAEAKTK